MVHGLISRVSSFFGWSDFSLFSGQDKANLDFVCATAEILFDCKGSDVGVVVSGPKSMRHEVAKICASGLAKNLSFESISFSW